MASLFVIIYIHHCFLVRFKSVTKPENVTVMLHAFSERIVKLLSLSCTHNIIVIIIKFISKKNIIRIETQCKQICKMKNLTLLSLITLCIINSGEYSKKRTLEYTVDAAKKATA